MKKVWATDDETLQEQGKKGREYILRPETGMTASEMNRRFTHDIQEALRNWKPRERYELIDVHKWSPKKIAWNGLTLSKEI